MANPDHLARILQEGVPAWNEWRASLKVRTQVGETMKPELKKWIDFVEWNLESVDLSGADLYGVNLVGINLTDADLSAANLTEADLRDADLREANLTDADLGRAHLQGANLFRAKLSGTNLRQANLALTVLADLNLQRTLGLENCNHLGPSSLDYQTLSNSGSLPLSFLRGCGLPDQLIDFLPSINQKIKFQSCFISYSTEDQSFADRLYTDLQNKGVRCWFAPHDVQGGKKLHEQIDAAIKVHDRLLLLLSEASTKSEWVKTEIAEARKREVHENRRMLFPLRLVDFQTLQQWKCFDGDTGKDSAREIREYYVPDFSNWKNQDSYQKEFDRLICDLSDLKRDEKAAEVTT